MEVVSLWLGLACYENTGNDNLRGIGFSFNGCHPHARLPLPGGRNELMSDTISFLPRGSGRQGCGSGQGRTDTAAMLAQGTDKNVTKNFSLP